MGIRLKYELQLWFNSFLKLLPGVLGCRIRNLSLPYRNGRGVMIWEGVQIDSPSKLVLGKNVSINRNCIIHAGGGVEIGKNTLIGPNVIIYSQNHKYTYPNQLINQQGYELKKVIIGDNVWIAAGVIILPGVVIGNNTVIGAGSIVTKSIKSSALAAGNPIKIIKELN